MKIILVYIDIIEENSNLYAIDFANSQKNLLSDFAKENPEFIFFDFDNYSEIWLVQQIQILIQQSDAFVVFIRNKEKAKLERIIPFFNTILRLKKPKLFLSQNHNSLINKLLSILPPASYLAEVATDEMKGYLNKFKIDFLAENNTKT